MSYSRHLRKYLLKLSTLFEKFVILFMAQERHGVSDNSDFAVDLMLKIN